MWQRLSKPINKHTTMRHIVKPIKRCFGTTKQVSQAVLNDFKMTAGDMKDIDEEIYNIISNERVREKESILLSPTSNYASQSVLDTLHTVLQNKYSEGYPKARYYGGNENVDDAELLTQKRALQLFNLNENEWKCNVQPLGGYNALFQVLTALILPSSKVMTPINNAISQKQSAINQFFSILTYDINNLSQLIDNYSPNLIISGNGVDASFNNFTIDTFKNIYSLKGNNCYHLCDISDKAGLIAANLVESPFQFADVVICSPFATLRGPRGSGMIFYRSELSAKIDGAVFPGHQGGPHNHTISALATSLKMANSNEFKDYQLRCVENAKSMQDSLKNKNSNKYDTKRDDTTIQINTANNVDMDILYNTLNNANIDVFYDKINNNFRVNSNAMTTRGLDSNDFNKIIDLFDDAHDLSLKIKEKSANTNDINALKSEVTTFAKQFPLINIE